MKIVTRVMRHLSLKRLVALCVGMTMLPVFTGLILVAVAFDRMASLSQQTVRNAVDDTRYVLELRDKVDDFERAARRVLATWDSLSIGELESAHEQYRDKLQAIMNSSLSNRGSLDGLDALAREENTIFESIASIYSSKDRALSKDSRNRHVKDPRNSPLILAWLSSLTAKVGEWSKSQTIQVETSAKIFENQAYGVKRSQILTFALMLFLISGLLLPIFLFLLHNPMQQIDSAIRALASGNFSQPIRVAGTGDIEFLGNRLEWLRTRLNDLEMAKQRFFRNASHEIKTPLATIHEGADLLMDEIVGKLNQEQKNIAGIMQKNTDRLDKLVGDLINYSQLSARKDYRKLELVNMRELVQNLLDDYQLQLRGKSIEISKSLENLELVGNLDQLRTAVDNLFSNAIKYSPAGGEIRLTLKNNGGHLEFEIEDDGPGIDPAERARVFEPFFQGRASRELGIKGTGLGLAIVAECVANHHGKVDVLESRNGEAGVLIRIQIPLQSNV